MNIYVVVEGEVGEKKLYKHWIPFVNPSLSYIAYPTDITVNNFYLIAGNGYPNYMNTITNAVHDVADNSNGFDRLVIAIDSEDHTYNDKYNEINSLILSLGVNIDYKIIVQHFCLETWALGNKSIYTRHTGNRILRNYKSIFDASKDDPELLPPLPSENLNRAQFAEKYLRALLNEKFRRLTYSKKNPEVLFHHTYFQRVKTRFTADNHIASFNNFLSAFV